jgi:hypothetical protein
MLLTAPVFGATDAELKEMTATILNLGGHLCARVVEIRPLKLDGQFEVTCIEYRGGSGQVRYILDARAGTAFKAGN